MSTPPDPKGPPDARALNDDDLLAALASRARDDARRAKIEEELMAFTEGTAPEPDRAMLASALPRGLEPEGVLQAFRPLDDAARERATDRILAGMTGAHARDAEPAVDVARRRRGNVTMIVGPLALAACVVLGIGVLGVLRSPHALPRYEMTALGAQPMRGAPEAVPSSAPSSAPYSGAVSAAADVLIFSEPERFRLHLRPQAAFEGPVGVRVFLVRGDDVRTWNVPADVSGEGAIRIVTPLDTLPPGSAGEWDMTVVVARPDALPERVPAASSPSGATQVLHTRVRFVLDGRHD